MLPSNRISIISIRDNAAEAKKNRIDEDLRKIESADFEAAITVAGHGKFQYLLFLAIIPVSWSTSIDTSSMAIILPSVECDLQITFFQKGILNAIIFVGMVSSGFLWGYIADVHGRRTVFICGYLADGICNVLSGISQNFWTLAAFKFLNGFIISGPHASMMSYCSEFYGVKQRVRTVLLLSLSVAFGNIVAAAMAWLVVPRTWSIVLWDGGFVYNSWRLFLSLCGTPMILGVVCLSFFPESPKFLMSRGRTEDALKVFQRIYSLNTGKPAEEYPIQRLQDESRRKVSKEDGQKERSQATAIFFNPHLPRVLLVVVMQFGTMLAMNTIRLWQPQLFTILNNFDADDNNTVAGDPSFCDILDSSVAGKKVSVGNSTCVETVVDDSVYGNTLIVSTCVCTCLLLASLLSNVLNHKNLLLICYGVTFTCIISMNWSSSMLLTLILTCLFISFTTVSTSLINGVTTTLFPTSLRTIAVSLIILVGRIGTIIGNLLFPILLGYGCLVPVLGIAAFLLIGVVLTCFLPLSKSTKN